MKSLTLTNNFDHFETLTSIKADGSQFAILSWSKMTIYNYLKTTTINNEIGKHGEIGRGFDYCLEFAWNPFAVNQLAALDQVTRIK